MTQGIAEWKYGRVEVRARLPRGKGFWPAIWMLGSNRSQAGWPACGEIDIMENVGFDPDTIPGTIHPTKYNHVKKTQKGDKTTWMRSKAGQPQRKAAPLQLACALPGRSRCISAAATT